MPSMPIRRWLLDLAPIEFQNAGYYFAKELGYAINEGLARHGETDQHRDYSGLYNSVPFVGHCTTVAGVGNSNKIRNKIEQDIKGGIEACKRQLNLPRRILIVTQYPACPLDSKRNEDDKDRLVDWKVVLNKMFTESDPRYESEGPPILDYFTSDRMAKEIESDFDRFHCTARYVYRGAKKTPGDILFYGDAFDDFDLAENQHVKNKDDLLVRLEGLHAIVNEDVEVTWENFLAELQNLVQRDVVLAEKLLDSSEISKWSAPRKLAQLE